MMVVLVLFLLKGCQLSCAIYDAAVQLTSTVGADSFLQCFSMNLKPNENVGTAFAYQLFYVM